MSAATSLPAAKIAPRGHHPLPSRLHQDFRRMQPFLRLLRDSAHHRPPPFASDGGNRGGGRHACRKGVKEFNIIAQDLSSYGLDLYGGHRLAQLVDRLADIPGVERIRLHYAYPADFPMDILDVMARRDNVCKYLDIALQHISDRVLTNMRRHISADETRRLLAEIRRRVPGIHIRTTLMVGFPGEEEADFEELMEFVREQRFERMGAFAYCEEEGTFAANNLPDLIPEDVKQERLSRLMALQEEISLEIQQEKKGRRWMS